MTRITTEHSCSPVQKLPPWFRQDLPEKNKLNEMKRYLREAGTHTVCESARCPNLGKCWGKGIATFMILGDVCTRACHFCAIKTGEPRLVDADEPRRIASLVNKLRLKYVVITSVTRDDLDDGGVGQFVAVVDAIRSLQRGVKVEVLIPDFGFKRESLREIETVRPDVINHNIETVKRLSPTIRPQAGYKRSLKVLAYVKELNQNMITKSGIMVGFGESLEELEEAIRSALYGTKIGSSNRDEDGLTGYPAISQITNVLMEALGND
jgi:lipoic acid synthetase